MSDFVKNSFFHKSKMANGEVPKTFQYDTVPMEAVNSILVAFEKEYSPNTFKGRNLISNIRNNCLQAFGKTFLYNQSYNNLPTLDFQKAFTSEYNGIEETMTYIQSICYEVEKQYSDEEIIESINWHLQSKGVGYKYVDGHIIRVEDETYFNNVTQTMLSILQEQGFQDTLTEYLKSYEELKNGQYKDAVTACTKALETIIKTRLSQIGITEGLDGTINRLLDILKDKIKIPTYMEDYINNLGSVIQGSATVRNKQGAHGSVEGENNNLDEVFVRYVINQTASSILFIAECEFNDE